MSQDGLSVPEGSLSVSHDSLSVPESSLSVSHDGLSVPEGSLSVSQDGLCPRTACLCPRAACLCPRTACLCPRALVCVPGRPVCARPTQGPVCAYLVDHGLLCPRLSHGTSSHADSRTPAQEPCAGGTDVSVDGAHLPGAPDPTMCHPLLESRGPTVPPSKCPAV